MEFQVNSELRLIYLFVTCICSVLAVSGATSLSLLLDSATILNQKPCDYRSTALKQGRVFLLMCCIIQA